MGFLYVLLVLIWSTGFITGKFLVGLIDPNIYLTIRFLGVGLVFTLAALLKGRHFPTWRELPKHIIAGMLMNGFYLAFAYVAIAKGLPAGIMALIGALQPALVTVLAFFLIKEKTSMKGILGMLIGMLGLVLVLSPVFELDLSHGGVSLLTLLFACLGIFSLSLGVTYQKMSISSSDLLSSMAIQHFAAAVVTGCFIWMMGEHVFKPQWETFALIVWGIVVLSCGGVFLMVWLLRKVKASQVTTVMLLVPPLAAVESYFLFNEQMTWVQIAGFAVTIVGVYLSRAKPA